MIVFPAIDLKDGVCVRLLRGDMGRATVFNTHPAAQARDFASAGFDWLHCVDLNGAMEGRPVNADAVAAILAAAEVKVQLGGGMRDLATVERWLDAGVARVILSTVALEQPEMVKEACKRWPGRIAVGIDARGGLVAVEGWTRHSNVKALDLALRFEDVGVAAIIYTDIGRDGAMVGANVEATVDLAFALTTPVIASGGVASIADIVELKSHENAGIAGVICGRALYDGRIDPAEALRVAAG
jgi:phosphoribosylformimino-5-aminoimidazole carboxamide ribotide isomerase